jgi:hypothetical protein
MYVHIIVMAILGITRSFSPAAVEKRSVRQYDGAVPGSWNSSILRVAYVREIFSGRLANSDPALYVYSCWRYK